MSSGLSVLVSDGIIEAIDKAEALYARYGDAAKAWDVVDCSKKLVMPGLIDGHNHLCNTHMNLARVFGIDYQNIVEHMFTTIHDPYGWMSEECLYDISLLSALNDLKHGATTIENSTILPDIAWRAMRDSGCRGILAPQMATSFQLDNDSLNWKQMLERTERCIRDYHDPDGGMSVVVHIHDQWDTLEEVMLRGMEMAQRYDTKYVTHFWEFADPRDRANRVYADEGGAFAHYMNRGLINDRCVFFHGSVLNESEIEQVAKAGASVIHNPEINGTNCGNCAYIPYMLECGVNVGVGSDYGSLDVMTSMKLSLLVHNIMPRAKKGLKARQSFRMATMGGAKAYGLEQKIGSIEPGKCADIVSIDMSRASHLAPMAVSAMAYDPEILLFLFIRNCAGTETCETMINGKFLRRDGKFLSVDEEAVMDKANYWFEKFLPELAERRAQGGHFARHIHPDYIKDEDLDLEALLTI